MSHFLFRNNRRGLSEDELLRLLERDKEKKESNLTVGNQIAEDFEPTVTNTEGFPVFVTKNGTKWSRLPKNTKVKLSNANIRRHTLGLTNNSTDFSSIKNAFLLFLKQDILNINYNFIWIFVNLLIIISICFFVSTVFKTLLTERNRKI